MATLKRASGTTKTATKAKTKGANKIAAVMTAKDLERMAEEYNEISSQIKVLDEKKKDLATKIKDASESMGVKDDKGSFYFEGESFVTGKVAKVSMSIKQDEAVKVLEAMGLGDVVDTVTTKTVNEQKLEKAVADNRCSLAIVEGFTEKKVQYQVSVKAKEVMPEIEQTELKSAAKRK